MKFNLKKKDKHSNARLGLIKTAHGNIETPIFMPVGTLGTVKAVHNHELINDTLAQIILSNTYHLYLRPGLDIIKNAGGIHNFIGWNKPLLTDSGGYQVYSLSNTRKITEKGVKFQSHIDGSYHFFTPEYAIDIQRVIGADIIMAFDECTPYPCNKICRKVMNMTHRWLKDVLIDFNKQKIFMGIIRGFPIVQGSIYKSTKISAEKITSFEAEVRRIISRRTT